VTDTNNSNLDDILDIIKDCRRMVDQNTKTLDKLEKLLANTSEEM